MATARHVLGMAVRHWETNQKSPWGISDYIVSSPALKVDGPVVKAFC